MIEEMKVLITGAHFTTAEAVIDVYRTKPEVEIVYVGRKTTREGDPTPSVESQVLPEKGIKFIPITTGRLQRTFTLYTIPSLLKIPYGFWQSWQILNKEKPDLVIGFGGYVSVPVVIAAKLQNIPILIHEQTLISGIANTICGWVADKVAVSFDAEYEFDKNKTVVTGNPIRQQLLNKSTTPKSLEAILSYAAKSKLPIVLVTGGNQGSHAINLAVEESLDQLLEKAVVIHQTGDSQFQDYERLTEKRVKDSGYMVTKWLSAEEMASVLRSADMIVSRAGINTLCDAAYFGLPMLLIPYPYISKQEQLVNAKYFAGLGAADILEQSELNSQNLLSKINSMLNKLTEWKEKATAAKVVARVDAASKIVEESWKLIDKQKQ